MRNLALLALVLALGAACGAPLAENSDKAAGAVEQSAAATTIEGLPNFRDLGGKETSSGHVKRGVLYRTEALVNLTDQAAWQTLGVRHIVDFRGAPEKEDAEDPDLGATHHAAPIFDVEHADEDFGAQLKAKIPALLSAETEEAQASVRADLDAWSATLKERMIGDYGSFATDQRAGASFKILIDTVLTGETTSFHCVSGKDRTGFAAAIILRGLGVGWRDLVNDYLQSNAALEPATAQTVASLSGAWPNADRLRAILGVDEAYLTAAFAKLQAQYGNGTTPTDGPASDAAIAAYYDATFGPEAQSKLRALLIE